MSDLYAQLGLSKDATKADIRAAYRKLSKKAHPDGGGSQQKFGALTKAHDILTDDERRAKYDATGDESEKAVDNVLAAMLENACQLLMQAMSQCVSNNIEPEQARLIDMMQTIGNKALAEIAENRGKWLTACKRLKKLQGRFKLKAGAKAKENRLEAMISGQIAGHEQQARNLDRMEVNLKAALDFIKDYDFTADKKPEAGGINIQFFGAGNYSISTGA